MPELKTTNITESSGKMLSDDNKGFVFASDLGGTYLRAALVDQDGAICFRNKQQTPHDDKPEGIVRALVNAFRQCSIEAANASVNRPVIGISVAVPGTVNVRNGVVIKAPNLNVLDGFHLAEELRTRLSCTALLENDANAAAVGEMWKGAGRGRKNIICLTLGTGVGGGIILDGKLWHGTDGAAAEIGHMCIDPFTGAPCGCGSRGCLEVCASATAIVRMTNELGRQYPDSRLPGRQLSSETIFEAGQNGDELAIEVFRRVGVYLGIGIATLINVLNPETIVIGGGVANGWELFEKSMRAEVMKRAFPLLADRIEIVKAECGDDAGLLGAARLAFTR